MPDQARREIRWKTDSLSPTSRPLLSLISLCHAPHWALPNVRSRGGPVSDQPPIPRPSTKRWGAVQGYLAHKKLPLLLGPSAWSYGVAVSYARGTPASRPGARFIPWDFAREQDRPWGECTPPPFLLPSILALLGLSTLHRSRCPPSLTFLPGSVFQDYDAGFMGRGASGGVDSARRFQI